MSFLLALSPIAVVLIGILYFKKPAMKVAPLGLVLAILLACTYFNINNLPFKGVVNYLDTLVWTGVKEGLKIVWMVFGAFVILNVLRTTGAIEDVKSAIAHISDDRRVQVIIIGLMLPIFLEGAAGAGAPAAIAAPFLVAIGVNPIVAIAVALLGDATPCSWGGAGLTTIVGGAALTKAGLSTVAMNSAMVGRIHMFGVMVIPFIMIAMVYGRQGFKNIISYLLFAGVGTGLVMFVLSNYVGAEVTSMGTGLIGILLSFIYVKTIGIRTPEEYRFKYEDKGGKRFGSLRAISPYLYMLVMLPVIRYGVPAFVDNGFALMCTFGYIVWVDMVIMVCGLLGAFTLGLKLPDISRICSNTAKVMMPVLITMGSLLIVAYIMQSPNTGMIRLIATTTADFAGILYPAAAVLIGASGSFVTGTGLGSNIMFADMHIQAAQVLGINQVTVFAGQNAGASLGNLICPNNTVAACATVGMVGQENQVMFQTLKAFAIVLTVYMVLTMVYTYILFPNTGI